MNVGPLLFLLRFGKPGAAFCCHLLHSISLTPSNKFKNLISEYYRYRDQNNQEPVIQTQWNNTEHVCQEWNVEYKAMELELRSK